MAQSNVVHTIKKPALQRLILDKSPRLSFEPMQPGARYRTIYNYVFLDGERQDGFVVCKLCQKPITVPKFGITSVKQHYHQHLMKGECPIYDNLTKTWNGLIDVRSALHQETMQKFVVPIKLPPEAYLAMQHYRPVQLFMEISKEVNFNQCPDGGSIPAKKAKENLIDLNDTLPLPPEDDDLTTPHSPQTIPSLFNFLNAFKFHKKRSSSMDDTQPFPDDDLFSTSPLPPLVIYESSPLTSSEWAKNSNTLDWHTPFAYIINCISRSSINSFNYLNVFQFYQENSSYWSSSNSQPFSSLL